MRSAGIELPIPDAAVTTTTAAATLSDGTDGGTGTQSTDLRRVEPDRADVDRE